MIALYLNDQLADLLPDTVMGLTFTLGDVGQITSRNASYSNQVKLPKSNANKIIFNNSDTSKSSGSAPFIKYSVRLFINGVQIKNIEYAILDSVSENFYITLYSGELNILESLENTYCSDLDYGISDNMDATFFQTYALGDMDVVTPVIDYGRLSTPPVNIDHFTKDSKWKSVKPIMLEDCLCASTANRALSGLTAVDGITPIAGDRVLLKNQSTPSENGIYIASSGTWTRSTDCNELSKLQGAVVRIKFGSTHGNSIIIQTGITTASSFTFLSGFPISPTANGFIQSSWYLDGSALSLLDQGKLPVTDELQLEWLFPALPQIAATESYAFSFDILTNILSGSVNYTFRLSLIDESGIYYTIIDQLINATGVVTVTGSILADRKFVKMAFQCILNVDYSGYPYPDCYISSKGYTVKVTPYTKNMEAEFNLPTVKLYKAIELILNSLGDYSLEYPTGFTSQYKSLLVTYSRDYYGLRDSPTAIDDTTTVNISQFVLPDISQKDLLVDWLFRTQSLIRNSNDIIEIKPISNIINDKTGAVDWTDKRASSNEQISFNSNKFQSNYFEDADLYKQDTDILVKNGFDDAQYDDITRESNRFNFAIADTTLKEEGTIYKSIFSNTQLATNNPHESSAEYFVWCPVWDWTSTDRRDFKHTPALRILYSFGYGFGLHSYYDGANQTDIRYGMYKKFSASEGGTWENMLNNGYQPFVRSVQQYKLIKRQYLLTEEDIANLDLFKLVFDNGEYFMISKISNYIAGRITSVELFKVT